MFKAQLDTPYGLYEIVVRSIANDARNDIYSAGYSLLKAPNGMLRIVGEVKKTNKRIISNMTPIKNATCYNSGQWAWAKRIDK